MALKTILLKRKIDQLRQSLNGLEEQKDQFTTREAELELAINEATSEDDMKAVQEEVEKFESERSEFTSNMDSLNSEIENLEKELEEEEKKNPVQRSNGKAKEEKTNSEFEIRQGGKEMNLRDSIRKAPKNVRALNVLPTQTRSEILQRDDVKAFLNQIRTAGKNKRSIEGGDLMIPIVFLDLIAENMYRYSKLIDRVRVRTVRGEARQTIAGLVPEAIWTEMCGAINELTFTFGQFTFDGYKVAGYIAICNSILEDTDLDLAGYIIEMLSESIGLAIDKAILYGLGSGSSMPTGIVTRLAQTSKPSGYPATAPEWIDLSETNLLSIPSTSTGAAFWSALVVATSAIANRYARGEKFWCMNSKTLAALQSKAITFTATGAIVAGVSDTLPVITGDIVVLEFMPDYDIVGGYGDLYLFVQRSGMQIEYDRSVQFLQDNTVFRGKQRADGAPIVPQAFVAININGTSPTTTMSFPADTANDADLQDLTLAGATLSPTFDADVLSYTTTSTAASAAINATPVMAGASVSISMNGNNINNGSTVKFSSGSNVITIQVENGNAIKVYTLTVTYSAA